MMIIKLDEINELKVWQVLTLIDTRNAGQKLKKTLSAGGDAAWSLLAGVWPECPTTGILPTDHKTLKLAQKSIRRTDVYRISIWQTVLHMDTFVATTSLRVKRINMRR
jgi:hypothetical protein